MEDNPGSIIDLSDPQIPEGSEDMVRGKQVEDDGSLHPPRTIGRQRDATNGDGKEMLVLFPGQGAGWIPVPGTAKSSESAKLIDRVPTDQELRERYGGKARAMHDAGVKPTVAPEHKGPKMFYVGRSNGEIEYGWQLGETLPNGKMQMYKVDPSDPNNPNKTLVKAVEWEDFARWQTSHMTDTSGSNEPKKEEKSKEQLKHEKQLKLFGPTQRIQGVEPHGGRKEFHTTSPESEEAARQAIQTLKRNDQAIATLLREVTSAEEFNDPEALRKIIATNTDLRIRVAQRLLRKMDENPTQMGQRVRKNNSNRKTANHGGYFHIGQMDPKDYTAMLVLAMLDGSYDPRNEIGDPIETTFMDDSDRGQHRYSAKNLISIRDHH